MSEKGKPESRSRGFLIMPFDPALETLRSVIQDVAEEAGVRLERADDIFQPGVIVDQILDAIDEADVVIAITTGRNPNVFFELGYSWRKHLPIVIADSSEDLPFDVAGWRTLTYGQGPEADDETFRLQLLTALHHVLREGRPLPRGYKLSAAPRLKQQAQVSARLEATGSRNHRLVLANHGTEEVHEVDVDIPVEARSLHLITEELPIKVLRPGERVSVPAAIMMGGGPSIFDITVRAVMPDGAQMEWPSKISL